MNTLILPGYLIINAEIIQTEPTFHNNYPVSITLFFTPQGLIFQLKKNMKKNLDDQLLIIQYLIYNNKKDSEKSQKVYQSEINDLKFIRAQIIVKMYKFSPEKVEPPNAQYPENLVPANNKSQPLEGENFTKRVECGLSNMISDHQNYINFSSKHNSKGTLLCN